MKGCVVSDLKRTAFYNHHAERDAKFVEFAGWEMPIHYGSIVDEHNAVRNDVGIFDVSHMARFQFKGRHARRFLERVVTRRVSDMKEKTCRYALVCNEAGGVLDDVLVYRFEDYWLMVANASNRDKLLAHFDAVIGDLSVKIEDQTESTAMVAIQGPAAMEYITNFSKEIPGLKRYAFTVKNLLILKLVVSRTGYTGENGVEIILPAKVVDMALKLLVKKDENGKDRVAPIGLGARDTLRLEAGMPLYGHELTEDIDPISADLSFAVSLDKDEDTTYGDPEPFIGIEALKEIAAEGPKQKRVGLRIDGKRTPRQGMTVLRDGQPVGTVTSGCMSPTLGYPIAMAYVDAEHCDIDTALTVDLGNDNTVGATVVPLPFYKAPA